MTTKTAEQAPTLAERLEKARQAEVAPRQRLAELEAAYKAAEEAHDHDEAARLERELQPAKEQAAFATALVRALSDQVAALDAERQSRQEAATRARRMDEARAERDRCLQAFTEAQEESGRHRAALGHALDEVRRLIAAALAADGKAQAAADSASDAKAALGESSARGSVHSPMKYLLEADQMLGMIWSRKDPIGGIWPR
jgi:hypothetical protein